MSIVAKTELDPIKKHFGDKLRTLRESRGYVLREAAKLMGVVFTTIHRVEKGKAFVSAEMLGKLCAFYRVPPAYFFDGSKVEIPEMLDVPLSAPRDITLTQALQVVEDRLGISMVIKRRPRPSEELKHVPPDVLRALASIPANDDESFRSIRTVARAIVADLAHKDIKSGKRKA